MAGRRATGFLSADGRRPNPDDVDLDDVQAVRQACAEIMAAVLDGRSQIAEVTT
jgi:hypothetical protein